MASLFANSAAMYNPLMPAGASSAPAGFGGSSRAAVEPPSTRTQNPIMTGTGVLALKFKGGVMLAADTLVSYGSTALYRDQRRLAPVGDNTVIGGSGDISDFQKIKNLINELNTFDESYDDGCRMTPRDIHQYLGRVMYNRRNKFNPLWNQLIVAGFRDGKSFLGSVDLIGTMYEDDVMATGFGNYMALPLLRKAGTELSKEEAQKVMEECLRVDYCRNCRASDRIQIATITESGIDISEPYKISSEWGYEGFKNTNFRGPKSF